MDNLEEYKKFKIENSVVTEYSFWKKSESKNLCTIKQGSSVNFEDSWMLGFINGELYNWEVLLLIKKEH